MNALRLSIATMTIALLIIFAQVVKTQADSSNSLDSMDQNEIEGVIESYFKIRYHALSTLQLEDFESLIDGSSEGDAFLGSESDKLEVEIQHAKLNQLRYSQYEFFLDFKDISIDITTQTATVSVIEGHDVVFEISEVISKTQPFVSTMRNLHHTITVRKEQDVWKIVSDSYEDYLWRLIRETGISKEDLLQSKAESQNQPPDDSEVWTVTACSLPSDESTHPYNRYGALAYVQR